MLLKIVSTGPYYILLPDHPFMRVVLNEPLQFLFTVTYNLFAIQFLELKKNYKGLYKLIQSVNVVYLIYAVAVFIYLYITKDTVFVDSLFIPTRIVVFLVGLTLIVLAVAYVKSPVKKYFVWGSSFFFIGSILGIVYSVSMYGEEPIFWLPEISLSPINLTQMGVVLEILLFSLGIGKLIHINNLEKEEIKDAYITQLERTEQLSKTHAQQLESKVKERTEEVLSKTTELANLQSQKQKIEFQRQLMDREMRVLRLQMNPHFIFNSLNSIRYFILKQDEEKAIEYIELFSKLLRMILDYSKRDLITLEEELQALELYVKFEKERFNQKFEYQIILDKELSGKLVAIPPLLLQPFAENSIWHGLMHQDKKGCLTIKIQKTSSTEMTIIIEDNGVGREKAAEIAARNGKKHQSHGMEITKSRIEMINETWNSRFGFKIEDLKSDDGKATGTRVVFTIKIQEYDSVNN
jgi:signal transduction histidine kinase